MGNVNKVEDQSNDDFVWHSPVCPADSKLLTLQVSWDKQKWQSILPLGKTHSFEYYDAPEVTKITPHFGPVKSPNGEAIVIEGKNFICPNGDCSDVTVRFGGPNDEV